MSVFVSVAVSVSVFSRIWYWHFAVACQFLWMVPLALSVCVFFRIWYWHFTAACQFLWMVALAVSVCVFSRIWYWHFTVACQFVWMVAPGLIGFSVRRRRQSIQVCSCIRRGARQLDTGAAHGKLWVSEDAAAVASGTSSGQDRSWPCDAPWLLVMWPWPWRPNRCETLSFVYCISAW